jgi:hypothetical protein
LASSPNFINAPRIGMAGQVSTANTNRDGTGTIVDVITGATGGTRINEVVVQATGDPADSIVTLFLFDGTNTRLFAEVDLDNPAAASATVTGYRSTIRFDNLVLPSSSWKLQAAITAAPTSGVVNVIALGGDLA